MALTKEEEIAMFGESVEGMNAMYKSSSAAIANTPYDKVLYAAAILSDAQAVLELMNDKETARQFINKAKHFMFEATSELRANGQF